MRYRRTWQQTTPNAGANAQISLPAKFSAQLAQNAHGQRVPQAGTQRRADYLLGLPNSAGVNAGQGSLRVTQYMPYVRIPGKSRANDLNYGGPGSWPPSTNPRRRARKAHGFGHPTG